MGSVDSSRNDGYKRTERCMSLPAWGAWIQVGMMDIKNGEISQILVVVYGNDLLEQWYRELMLCSRSPHGERGFKWFMRNTDSIFSRSLS